MFTVHQGKNRSVPDILFSSFIFLIFFQYRLPLGVSYLHKCLRKETLQSSSHLLTNLSRETLSHILVTENSLGSTTQPETYEMFTRTDYWLHFLRWIFLSIFLENTIKNTHPTNNGDQIPDKLRRFWFQIKSCISCIY